MGLGVALGLLHTRNCRLRQFVSIRHTNVSHPHRPDPHDLPAPGPRSNTNSLARSLRILKSSPLSLVMNWVIGPILMFIPPCFFLRDKPEYMSASSLIGIGPLYCDGHRLERTRRGNREYAAGLVALTAFPGPLLQPFCLALYHRVATLLSV